MELSVVEDLIGAVKDCVERATAPLKAKIAELEGKLAAMPAPLKGEPGKDAVIDYERVGEMLRTFVAAAVAQIPPAKNGDAGKDAEVDYDKIGDIIAIAVAKEAAKIPVPKDGLPGKDAEVDYGLIHNQIDFRIQKAVAEIPPPQNGKDVDMDVVRKQIDDAVKSAIAQIPKPKDGEPGKDAVVDYRVIEVSLNDLVEKAIAKIPKAKDGEPGKDAEPIHPDTLRLQIREEVEKAVGAIPKAKDGEPGRDAIAIAILNGLDESRSYPRGTYAVHNNALVLAERATNPVTEGLAKAGWRIMLETPLITVKQGDDLRTFFVVRTFASGVEVIDEFSLPVIIDRGVWKEGSYGAGDAVSWGGSMFVAQRQTNAKPEESSDWRLAVKRGRDGKDFEPQQPKRFEQVRMK